MSESWGGDLIPRQIGSLVEILSTAQNLPAAAIDAAVRAPGRVAEPILAVVERAAAGAALSDRDTNLLFWGIHILAQARDTRLFGPLLRLLRLPSDPLVEILGETIPTTLPRILIATFDGDVGALEEAILRPTIDELARHGLLQVLVFLGFEGRVERDRIEAILVRFDDTRAARAGDMAWAGWEGAIALGGFAGLAERVLAARTDARLLLDEDAEGDWFALTLADATARPDDGSRFDEFDLGPLQDAVAELDVALASDEEAEPSEPVVNPLRSVGRNDPCPCGSGLKHKKCCLGKTTGVP